MARVKVSGLASDVSTGVFGLISSRDFGGISLDAHRDTVDDADDASDAAHRQFGGAALIAPVDFARQGDAAALDGRTDRIERQAFGHGQHLSHGVCNRLIRMRLGRRRLDGEFDDESLDVFHPLNGLLNRDFLRVAGNAAAQGHNTVFHGYVDMSCVDGGIPTQFVEGVLSQLFV